MSKSVFEMIAEVMNNEGFKVLMYAWVITALLICWCYVIPMGIKHLIDLREEEKALKEIEKELREIQNENR